MLILLQTHNNNNDIFEAFLQECEVEEFPEMKPEDLRDCVNRYTKHFHAEIEVINFNINH